jgi:predicted RNase H-like HicB family nuclease
MAQSAPDVERFLELPYHIVLVHDEDGGDEGSWTARVEELPGCEARRPTSEEAARAISHAMEEWLAVALEKGAEIPEPRRPSTHSGRLLLRLPQDLHAELARRADSEEVSLNGLITSLLAGTLGWRQNGAATGVSLQRSPRADAPPRSRFLSAAILANIVVVILAALAATVLLIVALQNGW